LAVEGNGFTKEGTMNREASVWIDHRQAVVELVTDAGEDIKKIITNMEKYGLPNDTSTNGLQVEKRNEQPADLLTSYYEEVIALICDARLIQIFGLGEAKGEIEKMLDQVILRNCT
jgi:hypothetical protein